MRVFVLVLRLAGLGLRLLLELLVTPLPPFNSDLDVGHLVDIPQLVLQPLHLVLEPLSSVSAPEALTEGAPSVRVYDSLGWKPYGYKEWLLFSWGMRSMA